MEIHLLGDAVKSQVPEDPRTLLGQTQEPGTARKPVPLEVMLFATHPTVFSVGPQGVCKDCSYIEAEGCHSLPSKSLITVRHEKETTHAEDQTVVSCCECIYK